ncbi:unnamed protein product [Laminaria digitata]
MLRTSCALACFLLLDHSSSRVRLVASTLSLVMEICMVCQRIYGCFPISALLWGEYRGLWQTRTTKLSSRPAYNSGMRVTARKSANVGCCITMTKCANVAANVNGKNLRGRGWITVIPVLGKHRFICSGLHTPAMPYRCHAACSRSDGYEYTSTRD